MAMTTRSRKKRTIQQADCEGIIDLEDFDDAIERPEMLERGGGECGKRGFVSTAHVVCRMRIVSIYSAVVTNPGEKARNLKPAKRTAGTVSSSSTGFIFMW
jgi:hypothetical protein